MKFIAMFLVVLLAGCAKPKSEDDRANQSLNLQSQARSSAEAQLSHNASQTSKREDELFESKMPQDQTLTSAGEDNRPVTWSNPIDVGHSGSKITNKILNDGLVPDDRIEDFVSWLRSKGIHLEYVQSRPTGMWKLTQPKGSDEYDVVFSIRSFPTWASEEQMQEALMRINLAYSLNASVHLALSYGSPHGTSPLAKLPSSPDELPKLGGLPVTEAVQKLFQEYRPEGD